MLSLLSAFLSPVITIIIIVMIVRFIRGKKDKLVITEDGKLHKKSISKELLARELLFALSFAFLGVTIFTLNKDFDDLLSWRTILFIFSLIALVGAYYYKLILTIIFGLISSVSWLIVQSVEWADLTNNSLTQIKPAVVLLEVFLTFLIFYILGYLHKNTKWHDFNFVYLVSGLLFTTIYLFYFSTKSGVRLLSEITHGEIMFGSWQISIVIFILIIILVGTLIYALADRRISIIDGLPILFLVGLFVVLSFLPVQEVFSQKNYYFNQTFNRVGIFWASLFNIIIFFYILWITLSGYFKGERWLINFGVIGFFILIFVKYVDWFFNSLHKSIFFLGAGIILFVVGWLMERGRRYMIATTQNQKET